MKRAKQIFVPLAIVLVLVGLYFVKNQDKFSNSTTAQIPVVEENTENQIAESTQEETADQTVEPSNNIQGTQPEENEKTTESTIQNITAIDLEAISSLEVPLMIDFYSDGCTPCLQMKPEIQAAGEKLQDKGMIQMIDVWKYPEGTANFPIQVIPTQAFFLPNGAPYQPSAELEPYFDLYGDSETGEHVLTLHVGALSEEDILEIFRDMGADV